MARPTTSRLRVLPEPPARSVKLVTAQLLDPGRQRLTAPSSSDDGARDASLAIHEEHLGIGLRPEEAPDLTLLVEHHRHRQVLSLDSATGDGLAERAGTGQLPVERHDVHARLGALPIPLLRDSNQPETRL